MVRSICKAALGTALVTAVAWVGLAWSQSPQPATAGADAAAGQVTMTVHENGKAIQCRLLTSWRCANGARAFQLEVLDSGEKLTMVEDGPGSSFQSKAGRMRSLPMRIFHWGRSRSSPPGAPVPPQQLISTQDVGEPTILNESDPVLVRISPEPVAPPGSEICSCEQNPGTGDCAKPGEKVGPPTGTPYNTMNGSLTCTSKPCEPPAGHGAPVAENKGPNSLPTAPGIPATPIDHAKASPSISSPSTSGAPTANPLPPISPGARPALPSNVTAQPGSPPAAFSPMVVGPPPALLPQMPSASGPQLIPIDPSAPALPAGVASATLGNPPSPGSNSGALPGSLPSAGMTNAMSSPASQPGQMMPPPANPGAAKGTPTKTAQGNQPHGLVNRMRNALNLNDKKPQLEKTKLAPAQLTNRVSPDPQKTAGPQLAEMAKGQPSATGTSQGMLPSINRSDTPPATAGVGALPSPALGAGPLSAPATSMGSPSAVSPSTPGTGAFPLPYQGGDLTKPQGSNAPSVGGQGSSAFPLGNGNNAPPTLQPQGTGKDDPAKRDWRNMWGKPPAGSTQAPGQSVIEPTPSGKGPMFAGMHKDKSAGPPPGLFSTMPPTSMVQNSKQPDPLMSPERYGTPKVENKSLGDRRVMGAARYQEAPAAPANNPAAPVGIQSVVSAHNGVDMPLRFVPVPMVTIPQPMRPPGPPKPDMPQPPGPSDWTNAFAPVRQPANAPNAPPTGPVPPGAPGAPMANLMGPGYIPGYYGPQVDPRMMPGMQMARPPYGPNPYANPAMMASAGPRPPMAGGAVGSGQWPWDNDAAPSFSAYKSQRPVAHIAYPQTYAGPMAPNPVTSNMMASNMNPPGYMPALQPYAAAANYQPMPVPVPMYPPSYPQNYPPMQPRPELAVSAAPPAVGIDPASVPQLMGVLLESPYPAQREWAAMNLAAIDLQACPDVLHVLLTAAKKDPAASVRASCVQCVARQNLTSQPVLTTLHSLTSDPDPRVRTDAEQALIRLTGSHSTMTPRPIQPVNGRQ